MNELRLLDKVASSENLWKAFRECARGKRSKLGYQRFFFGIGERLVDIQRVLLAGTYTWQRYREFIVKDPKARVIMAAPFRDRIVHHAIHRTIEPIFDPLLSHRTYACRKGKGSSRAVLDLWAALKAFGACRWVVKLDVAQYFSSISHDILLASLFANVPDESLNPILTSLVRTSHKGYAVAGKGIPIGNLTSQLFANWMLNPADRFIESEHPMVQHFRYMDDIVLLAQSKNDALKCAHAVVQFASEQLLLSIPFTKIVTLSADPVPFLGYLLHHNGYKILARNRRRFHKHVRRLRCRRARDSRVAQAQLAYEAWTLIPKQGNET
jgi:retron-type reverse transcriptase